MPCFQAAFQSWQETGNLLIGSAMMPFRDFSMGHVDFLVSAASLPMHCL